MVSGYLLLALFNRGRVKQKASSKQRFFEQLWQIQ